MIDGRRRRGGEATAPDAAASEAPLFVVRRFVEFGRSLARAGVSADQVTLLGIALAAGTGIAIGFGALYLGVALLIVGGLMDALDGIVAKAAGSTSTRGAFFDSVADRISDALIFGGVAWYLLDGRHPREAIIPIALLAVSSIVSYTRAKAESLGLHARGGLMERAERLILLGVALAFHVVLLPLLVVLLVLTAATAAGRFRRVWMEASGPALGDQHLGGMEFRWRSFRDRTSTASAHRRARSRTGDLQPLTTRLRGVLKTTESSTLADRQGAKRRERRTRAVLRRFESEH